VNFRIEHNSVSSAGRGYIKVDNKQISMSPFSVTVSIQNILIKIDVH